MCYSLKSLLKFLPCMWGRGDMALCKKPSRSTEGPFIHQNARAITTEMLFLMVSPHRANLKARAPPSDVKPGASKGHTEHRGLCVSLQGHVGKCFGGVERLFPLTGRMNYQLFVGGFWWITAAPKNVIWRAMNSYICDFCLKMKLINLSLLAIFGLCYYHAVYFLFDV